MYRLKHAFFVVQRRWVVRAEQVRQVDFGWERQAMLHVVPDWRGAEYGVYGRRDFVRDVQV